MGFHAPLFVFLQQLVLAEDLIKKKSLCNSENSRITAVVKLDSRHPCEGARSSPSLKRKEPWFGFLVVVGTSGVLGPSPGSCFPWREGWGSVQNQQTPAAVSPPC